MTIIHIRDRNTPIGELLDDASRADGILVEIDEQVSHAILPLDDELLDFLVERNPAFMAECDAIRARMRAGDALAHEDVVRLLAKGA